MQAERNVSQEALGWFQRTIGAAPQGPNLSVVMGPRMAVMALNLARSVREGSLGLLKGWRGQFEIEGGAHGAAHQLMGCEA
jgi:hypothetical protein